MYVFVYLINEIKYTIDMSVQNLQQYTQYITTLLCSSKNSYCFDLYTYTKSKILLYLLDRLKHFTRVLKTAVSKIILFSFLPLTPYIFNKEKQFVTYKEQMYSGCLEGASRYYQTANALLLAAAHESRTISQHMLIFVSLTNLSPDQMCKTNPQRKIN